jgi:hypothetical protein
MSWFKKAQKIIEEYEDISTYMDIGHIDNKTPNSPNVIWIFYNGKIEAKEEISEEDTHGTSFGKNIKKMENFYKGRYEPDSGSLSISTPWQNRGRPIPNIVMKSLYIKFPHITKVYKY